MTMTPLDYALTAGSALVATPLVVFGSECLLACLPRRSRAVESSEPRPRIAVLVPAHNEELHIAETIRAILPQLGKADRLIVIADNCDDETVTIAEALGTTVLVRHDLENRGKGYAIQHGLDHLQADPPEIVVSIDADCIASPGAIGRIVEHCRATGMPVQASYLMEAPADAESTAKTSVSEFAVLVKNHVRPRGLQAAGLPCLLTGSGMAYPWEALRRTPHPDSHIVEDMHYAVDLAVNGYPPRPCMDAEFTARLPSRDAAFTTQRTRWEHGHLATIGSQAPKLLAAFLRTGRPSLLAMLLELATPPLSLLVATAMLVAAALAGLWLIGFSPVPMLVIVGAGLFAGVGLLAAWWKFGRRVLPPRQVLAIPGYVLTKLPLYRQFVKKPESGWVRTSREGAPVAAPHYAADSRPATSDRQLAADDS
ncbi:MAG: glycosyltransferase [Planctomycetota bacterium]